MEDKKILEIIKIEKKFNNKDILLLVKRRIRRNREVFLILYLSAILLIFSLSLNNFYKILNLGLTAYNNPYNLDILQLEIYGFFVNFIAYLFQYVAILFILRLIFIIKEAFNKDKLKEEKKLIDKLKNGH